VIGLLRHLLLYLKYRHAAVVNSRAELETALAAAPPRILVEGDEGLRAYAASLAYRGGAEAAALEASGQPRTATATMVVPALGRIRDGYRDRRRRGTPRLGLRIGAGVGTVLAAAFGVLAALLLEWLSFPVADPGLVRGPRHAAAPGLAGVAKAAASRLPQAVPPHPGSLILTILSVLLAAGAVAAMGFLLWQAVGVGRPMLVSWRVEYRVQGRLVMARVRTRAA
jgi:hypothetical protein